jgi:hypothetical protein
MSRMEIALHHNTQHDHQNIHKLLHATNNIQIVPLGSFCLMERQHAKTQRIER